MRKHMFIVQFEHSGARTIDTYVSCIWPIHSSGNDRGTAKAYLAMIDGEKNLPEDVQRFMTASKWMWLRVRYAKNADGPYIINDEKEAIAGRDEMEKYIQSISYEQLQKYLQHLPRGERR